MKVLLVPDSSISSTTKSLLYTQLRSADFSLTEAALVSTPSIDSIALVSGPLALPQNGRRGAKWAKTHLPSLYLSFGGVAATVAHIARRATGGNGMSVLYLSAVQSPTSWHFGAWLERRAILHCDRILVPSADLAHRLVRDYHARGGDIRVVSLDDPRAITDSILSFFQEPPGWMG